jgi:hypothetical protein
MNKTKLLIAAVATIALAITGVTLAASKASNASAASGPSYHGCPYGAVCIYPQNKGFNNGDWTYAFYSFAGHNIYNQVGTHRIVDNQYGSHYVGLCAKANGKGGFVPYDGHTIRGEGSTSYSPKYWDADLRPVNSLDLRPQSQNENTCYR